METIIIEHTTFYFKILKLTFATTSVAFILKKKVYKLIVFI